VNVDVDVDGYYTGAGGTGSVFVPITPVRVADTRTASLVGTETPIAASTSESFNLATTTSGIPATASSVAANFTVVAGDASGYLTDYPTSDTTNPSPLISIGLPMRSSRTSRSRTRPVLAMWTCTTATVRPSTS